jgi:hypothetical protein
MLLHLAVSELTIGSERDNRLYLLLLLLQLLLILFWCFWLLSLAPCFS